MPENPSNRSLMHLGSIPVDAPKVLRPGVMHREADAPGNAEHYALPPEAPERQAKGDLGFAGLVPEDYSAETVAAFPFANLRKEK